MNPISTFIKRYPQGTFWVIAWSTFLIGNLLGGLWFLLIYGSFLGGLFVTAVVDGRQGVKSYFSRIVRWRVGMQWYLVALFAPAALYLLGAGLNILAGARLAENIQWPAWPGVLIGFFWPGLFGIALAEEPGFRGFALPRLLVGRTALAAALILGVLHAIWHIPTFLGGEMIPIVCTILIILSGSIINTWLFNHSGGSVLLAMLMHASIDVVSGDVGLLKPIFTGAAAERQIIFQAVAFVAFAVLLPILAGRELGRRPEMKAGSETPGADQVLIAK